MKIGFASDHRGYKLKKQLIDELQEEYEIVDYGTSSEKSTDYPDYAFLLGENVSNKKVDFGVAICGSGIGISIACNKVKGVRCAKVDFIKEAIVTRKDNDSNIVAISGEMNFERAVRILEEFINTNFSGLERHIKRIKQIDEYEKKNK